MASRAHVTLSRYLSLPCAMRMPPNESKQRDSLQSLIRN